MEVAKLHTPEKSEGMAKLHKPEGFKELQVNKSTQKSENVKTDPGNKKSIVNRFLDK